MASGLFCQINSSKRDYEQRKMLRNKEGVCINCLKEKAREGLLKCEKCALKQKEAQQRSKEKCLKTKRVNLYF